jgi:hypothetical protein
LGSDQHCFGALRRRSNAAQDQFREVSEDELWLPKLA